jgi:hypothetical protein
MMTEIIPLNKTEDKVYHFDDLSIGDMFKLRYSSADIYIRMPDGIDIGKIGDWHTEIRDLEREKWNAFNLDRRYAVWMDDDTEIVPIRRVHLEYQMTI